MSIAQRWKNRVQKGEVGDSTKVGNAGPGGKGTLNKSQLLNLLDTGLEVALKALKKMKSQKDKVAHKRERLVPEFVEYVNRLMEKGWEHALLPWYMLWCLDAGVMEKALEIAKYCMGRDIKLDDEYFKRDIPTVVADLMHKWAEQAFKDGHSPEPYFSEVYDLVTTSSGTDPWAQHDQVTAKFYKLKGQMEYQAGNLEAAKLNFEKGLELGATVKTVLAEVTKKVNEKKEFENAAGFSGTTEPDGSEGAK